MAEPLDNNAPVAPLASLASTEADPAPTKPAETAATEAAKPARKKWEADDVRLHYVGKDGAHTVWGDHPLPAADIRHGDLKYFGLTRKADRAVVVATGLYESADETGADEE